MVDKLDHLDLEIIRYLQKQGRISLTELARKVKSSRPTVTYRLKRLIDEELIIVVGGLNPRKFGFKIAVVGLEVKRELTTLETYLRKCPRVLEIFRTPGKANIHLCVWGEDDQTISSTIESFRSLQNVDIIDIQYLGTPIHGDIIINVGPSDNDKTPCGMECANCYRYNDKWCTGCPASRYHRNPIPE